MPNTLMIAAAVLSLLDPTAVAVATELSLGLLVRVLLSICSDVTVVWPGRGVPLLMAKADTLFCDTAGEEDSKVLPTNARGLQ